MKNEIREELESLDRTMSFKTLNSKEAKGIFKALQDYKTEVLGLEKLPATADCMLETIEAEKMFRRAITNDLRSLIEINCASCPLGFTKDNCEADSCPFASIKNILDTRLKQLDQILPGGV